MSSNSVDSGTMSSESHPTTTSCFGINRERYPSTAQLFDTHSTCNVTAESFIICDAHVNTLNRHTRHSRKSDINDALGYSLMDDIQEASSTLNAQPLSPSAFISNTDYKRQHERECRGEMLNFDDMDHMADPQNAKVDDEFFLNKENVRMNIYIYMYIYIYLFFSFLIS